MATTNSSQLDAFMNALIGQESGGDPSAQNDRTGAYGIGQIMPENWVPWALEAGANPDDYSEANQRRIIKYKLQQYFNSFGTWEDVASAWYSGQPMSYWSASTLDAPQGYGNEPSIREYVNGVMGRMAEQPNGGSPSPQYAPRADNLSEPFGSRVDALIAAFGGRVGINSGYRSIEEQTALWENSDKSGTMVAAPGSSKHNFGQAVDLWFVDDATMQEVHAVAESYGLWFPMDYENWHIEPIGSRDGTYVEAVSHDGTVKNAGIMGIKGWDVPGISVNPLAQLSDLLDIVGAVRKWTNFHNMMRVGQFLLGAIVFLFGIGAVLRKPAMTVINTVASNPAVLAGA